MAAGPGLGLGSSVVGDGLTLAAALCWAIYTSWGAPILASYSPLRTTAWAMVGGSLMLAVPAALQATGADWGAVRLDAWAGLAFSAFIPAGLANVVVFSAIRLLGPTRVTVYQFLVPFIAVMLSAAFLSETIRPGQLIGGAVIVLGLVVARSDRLTAFGGWLRTRAPG